MFVFIFLQHLANILFVFSFKISQNSVGKYLEN